METNKAASVASPTKKRSLGWVTEWSVQTVLLQTATKTNLPPDLERLTPSQAANALTMQSALLWFSVAGAGAAVLTMLVKDRARIHRALAGVGLASAVAIHCVLTWLLGVTLVVAGNGGLLFLMMSIVAAVAFVMFAVVDVNASLALLGRPGWDWEEWW